MKRETCFLCKNKNNLIETKLCNNCFSYNFNTEDIKEPKFIIKEIRDIFPLIISITFFLVGIAIPFRYLFGNNLELLMFELQSWRNIIREMRFLLPIMFVLLSTFFLGLQIGNIRPKIKVIKWK
jgi:hypothetical protein